MTLVVSNIGIAVYNDDKTLATSLILDDDIRDSLGYNGVMASGDVSFIYQVSDTEQYITLGYITPNGSSDDEIDGGEFSFGGVVVVDLTAAFGEGNEPTKEWCDENISWFDGTTYINI